MIADWRSGVALLDPDAPPDKVPPHRWEQFVADCRAFLASPWAERAERLGWSGHNLFGCCLIAPLARVDRMGLIWLLKGGTIERMGRDLAVIRCPDNALQSFRPDHITAGRALPWELI